MKKSMKLNKPQLCTSYELFYSLLFDCDPTCEREVRAQQLLRVLYQLDAMGDMITRRDFSDLVSKAVVACGFVDEDEAWEALTPILDNTTPGDRNGSN
jgi:hypothetical protein